MTVPQHPRAPRRRAASGAAVVLTCLGLVLPQVLGSGGAGSTGDAVVAAALAQVGDAYVWGGNGPDSFDCSGLTSWVWRTAGGVSLPRTSDQQQRWAVPVPAEQLLPGDLVFFGTPAYHVAVYEGTGRLVDASSSRTGVVERAVWSSPDISYGRVPRPDMPPVAPWTPPSPVLSVPSSPLPSATASPGPSAAPSATPGMLTSPPAAAVAAVRLPVPTPSPVPAPAPATSPRPAAPRPAAAPSARATGVPTVAPVARPAAGPPPLAVPATQRVPSSTTAFRSVGNARTVLGSRAWTDLALVRAAWRHADGPVLPATARRLVATGRPVVVADLRVGDLVVTGPATAPHLALYAGRGTAAGVDPSGRVALVPVPADARLVRLPLR